MKSSCYNCQDRKLGCHSYCSSYRAYREKREMINEKIEEEMIFQDYLGGAVTRMGGRRGYEA